MRTGDNADNANGIGTRAARIEAQRYDVVCINLDFICRESRKIAIGPADQRGTGSDAGDRHADTERRSYGVDIRQPDKRDAVRYPAVTLDPNPVVGTGYVAAWQCLIARDGIDRAASVVRRCSQRTTVVDGEDGRYRKRTSNKLASSAALVRWF